MCPLRALYLHIHDFSAFVDSDGDGLVFSGRQQDLLEGFTAALGTFHSFLDQDFLQSHGEGAELIPYRSQKLVLGVNPTAAEWLPAPAVSFYSWPSRRALKGLHSDWLLLLGLVC